MENRDNFIKAIKKIKTEDTAHRKSDVGKVKATYGQQWGHQWKILHMLKLWQYW